ncbi:MAG TPA: hypothetical protein VNA69_11885 [Thermoanaerobaculia bacterium]|nr:hypothetical protein [Thermoanaerobaculia bacterium]
MDRLTEKKANRFRVINEVYERTDGDTSENLDMWQLSSEIGFDPAETQKLVDYLVGESLLEYRALGGVIGITHYGVVQVEAALTTPERATQYFPPVINIHIETMKELVMGDQYKTGQAGAVGPQSHAQDMHFNQIWSERGSEIDLPKLAQELSALRTAMTPGVSDSEKAVALGEVAQAERAALANDGPGVIKHLASAGRWALETAEKIGVALAAALIKSQLGL